MFMGDWGLGWYWDRIELNSCCFSGVKGMGTSVADLFAEAVVYFLRGFHYIL